MNKRNYSANRLDTICSLIYKVTTIADIGCDHGKVSEFIYSNNLATNLIVNDISPNSISKAKRSLCKNSANNNTKISFIECDGADLNNYIDKPIDLAIIAGMGGHEIIKIISNLMPSAAILDPRNCQLELRTALIVLGYIPKDDICVKEDNRFYDIVFVEKSTATPAQNLLKYSVDIASLMYGFYCKNKSDNLRQRLEKDYATISSYPLLTQQSQHRLQIIKEILAQT